MMGKFLKVGMENGAEAEVVVVEDVVTEAERSGGGEVMMYGVWSGTRSGEGEPLRLKLT